MDIAIIGTGFIGMTLGKNLAATGHEVTFGSRTPDGDAEGPAGVRTASIGEALVRADAVILAIPAAQSATSPPSSLTSSPVVS